MKQVKRVDAYPESPPSTRFRSRLTWVLLSGLLALRLPYWVGLTIYLRGRPDWVGAVFEIGTYALILCLVLLHIDALPHFHIDLLSVAMILVFKPLETILLSGRFPTLPLALPRRPAVTVWVFAAVAAVVLWIRRRALPKLRPRSFLWPLVGGAIGIVGALALGFFLSFRVNGGGGSRSDAIPFLLRQAALWTPYQIGYAGLSEEPLFRGFLWGQLRRHGWRDSWILVLQTVLFMIGHLYYVIWSPISFWITVPLGAIGLGLLAWRTRTISSSMVAHGFVNALSGPAEAIFAGLRT